MDIFPREGNYSSSSFNKPNKNFPEDFPGMGEMMYLNADMYILEEKLSEIKNNHAICYTQKWHKKSYMSIFVTSGKSLSTITTKA